MCVHSLNLPLARGVVDRILVVSVELNGQGPGIPGARQYSLSVLRARKTVDVKAECKWGAIRWASSSRYDVRTETVQDKARARK